MEMVTQDLFGSEPHVKGTRMKGTSVHFDGGGKNQLKSRSSLSKLNTLTETHFLDEASMRKKLDSLPDSTLLTALDDDECGGCRNVCYVLRKSRRASIQIFTAVLFMSGWIVMGVLQCIKAYESENADFFPHKITKQETYFSNSKLQYSNPYLYFWFQMDIRPENLKSTYSCPEVANSTADCLKDFFVDMLTFNDNILSWLGIFDFSDADYDYNYENSFRRKNRFFNSRKTKSKVGTRRRYAYEDVLYPYCEMNSFNQSTGETVTTWGHLKDYSVYAYRAGDYSEASNSDYDWFFFDYTIWENAADLSEPFDVLIKLEIADVKAARGRYTCDSSLDIYTISERLRNFTEWFDIYMFMSRVNYSTGFGIGDDEPQMRNIYYSKEPISGANMWFFYQENVFCDVDDVCKSQFVVESTAMVMADQDWITITLNPLPKVTYYKEFISYTYLDCASSIGGFWTIFLGLYLVVSGLIVKGQTKGKHEFKSLGILPLVSKAHKNAEEIAYLRTIVMTLLNVEKNQYFKSVDESSSEDSQGNVKGRESRSLEPTERQAEGEPNTGVQLHPDILDKRSS